MTNAKEITCTQTLAISTHRAFPRDLNNYGFMFGGKLLELLDDVASISVSRFTRLPSVTASIDQFNFIQSFQKDDSVCIETYISGAGKRSVEVFAKIIGEALFTEERYIGATAFMTFVLQDRKTVDALLVPETKEQLAVTSGYPRRHELRKQELADHKALFAQLDTQLPWTN
ncbi:acyl-CoA thioesterase [Agrilactobacillus fermenti]|uniref:acyl-CoA thioesterase n=1 Tax=Agrilactobacillus fermenti TaxID=2586909 RepID=UPI001E62CF10|nr:acyl-CoA thioesterase [Agrilactobacillus fermenti]MCD2257095.1 acyl-CoA thioesterase [Agrilactobacillus fermenti]